MRLLYALALIGVAFSALPSHQASAYVLTGKDRREYERLTSEGVLSTSCDMDADHFVLWAGRAPSVLEVDGKQRPIQFETHKVGDYLKKPYQCHLTEGVLDLTTGLTHITSDAQCGAGSWFTMKLAVAHVGSYSDEFLVDGCGGTMGLLVRGKHVLLCRLPDEDQSGVGHCAEAVDSPGPRELR